MGKVVVVDEVIGSKGNYGKIERVDTVVIECREATFVSWNMESVTGGPRYVVSTSGRQSRRLK